MMDTRDLLDKLLGGITQILPHPSQYLQVIYEGSDHIQRILSDTSILQRNYIGDKPFILIVGSDALHKNLSSSKKSLINYV